MSKFSLLICALFIYDLGGIIIMEILKKLVEFNTIKDKENKNIIDYIESELSKLGFKTQYKGKYLIMQYGENPKVGFLGHTDTVEYVKGWKTDPLKMVVKNENIYGLGVCDMKSGIAAFINACKNIDLSKLKYGIKAYFTYDEEIGFGGIYDIVKSKEEFPEYMIYGEPTNNIAYTGGKGLLEIDINFLGIKAHSSNPDKGLSANLNGIKMLNELNNYYEEEIKCLVDEKYEIPYTTMNVGILNGGSAKNSVACSCLATLDFRITDRNIIKMIKEKLDSMKEEYKFEYKVIEEVEPFYNDVEFLEKNKTVNFMTEASFGNNKSKKIILGAGPVTAHEIDEHISIKSYNTLINQYKEIIKKVN